MATFEDLEVFKRAVALSVGVYRATENFPATERYGLTAQMRRAAVSVVSNIAEGQGRLTHGEWRQALSQARGSLFELEAQSIVALHLQLLTAADCSALRGKVKKVAQVLTGLITYVRRCERARQEKKDTEHESAETVNRQP